MLTEVHSCPRHSILQGQWVNVCRKPGESVGCIEVSEMSCSNVHAAPCNKPPASWPSQGDGKIRDEPRKRSRTIRWARRWCLWNGAGCPQISAQRRKNHVHLLNTSQHCPYPSSHKYKSHSWLISGLHCFLSMVLESLILNLWGRRATVHAFHLAQGFLHYRHTLYQLSYLGIPILPTCT